MNESTDTTSDTPPHREFKLTPLPGAEVTESDPQGGGRKWGRRLLLGGAVVTPVIVTMRSRRAFAAPPKCSYLTKISMAGAPSVAHDCTP